ncbi:hypothetical protein LTR66_004759 [Elasticomyces elasticus]|nr:hypothetical protein LTR66_004759 [Elasticomyces elasticus]
MPRHLYLTILRSSTQKRSAPSAPQPQQRVKRTRVVSPVDEEEEFVNTPASSRYQAKEPLGDTGVDVSHHAIDVCYRCLKKHFAEWLETGRCGLAKPCYLAKPEHQRCTECATAVASTMPYCILEGREIRADSHWGSHEWITSTTARGYIAYTLSAAYRFSRKKQLPIEDVLQVYAYIKTLERDGELSNKVRVKPVATKNDLDILIDTVFSDVFALKLTSVRLILNLALYMNLFVDSCSRGSDLPTEAELARVTSVYLIKASVDGVPQNLCPLPRLRPSSCLCAPITSLRLPLRTGKISRMSLMKDGWRIRWSGALVGVLWLTS